MEEELTRSKITGSGRFFTFKWVLKRILSIFCRVELKGKENIPSRGPVILAPNHISYFDPPIIGITIPRKVHFMTMHDLFEGKFSAWLMKKVGAFPVKRNGPDRRSIEHAMAILKREGLLCIFPEGGINEDEKRMEAKEGLGLIAFECLVPVVPAVIAGTRQLYKLRSLFPPRPRVKILIGEMIDPRNVVGATKKEMRRNLLKLLMDRVYDLKEKVEQGLF